VSFIAHQLAMGEPIEHEHTKDHKLAMDIALQHLDEIPDYYTRLKKMEASAKKEHKKFKDVTEGNLHRWFQPGWVDVVDGDACAREEGETATPKCVSPEKRASMSKEERLAAQAAKRREDPNQPQKSDASRPTMVKTDRKTRKEEMNLQEVKDKPGKGSGKKDACYTKVKSRYDVWPSAYASGALVKCRKVGAANWGTKSEAVNAAQQAAIAISMKKRGIKPKEMKEETGMVRYCPKCKKDETQSECKYGPKFWALYSTPSMLTTNQMKFSIAQVHPANEEKDHEYSMARSELDTITNATKRLKKKMKGEGNIEAWVQSKITKAADYIDTAADYIDSGESKVNEDVTIEDANGNTFLQIIDIIRADRLVKEGSKSGDQGLHDWFGKSKSSTGKKGWVQLGGKFAGEPCARQEGQTSTPKCGSSKMAANLSPEEEEKARRRKNKLDPNQPQKSGASKPTNVRTEEINIQEVKDKAGKGSGKKDACYNKVKSRYDVWPSAYASGALVRCRKVGAANWGTKSEDCWDGYKQVGVKKKGKKIVPNCVPEQLSFEIGGGHKAAQKQAKIRNLATGTSNPNEKKVALGKLSGPSLPLANSYTPKTFDQFMIEASPAWQRKEGKNSEGGLNKKGIASYRKENPGSNLSLAVTTEPSKLKPGSKKANRRKSFCSRMSGMKKKLTSAKTANDPNSRINKSLRKWNC
jgi:hypothetical protein